MDTSITTQEWYKELVEECKAIITESVFTSRWALVEGNWHLGQRIREDKVAQEYAKGNKSFVQDLARNIHTSERTLYYALQLFDTYPNINKLPEGKNISMNKIITKYLPSTAHVSFNSGENEWYTPPSYIEAARKTMGSIDLDPASTEEANKIVQAKQYYTLQKDGLKQEWRGNIWMNPPYSQPDIEKFCTKLIESPLKQACVLVNNATETVWFQTLLQKCVGVCFIRGRVKFIDKDGNATGTPLQGQAILYFGDNKKVFKENFSSFGTILWIEDK